MEDGFVGRLSLPIGLGMRHCREVGLAAQVTEVVRELASIKLQIVVENVGTRDAKSGNDVPLDKLAHFCCGNGGDDLSFDPLGEVVYGHKKVLALARGFGEGAKNIHAPCGEREWADYRRHMSGGDSLDG